MYCLSNFLGRLFCLPTFAVRLILTGFNDFIVMDETKTFVFPDRGYGNSIDPNLLLNNGGGMGGWNNPFWALILLAFLGRGYGYGGDGGGCNTSFVASQLGQAIAGNANSISNLATSLNCTEGQIQAAIANVQNAIQNVANQNGMNACSGRSEWTRKRFFS